MSDERYRQRAVDRVRENEQLRAEIERLRAENEELRRYNRELVDAARRGSDYHDTQALLDELGDTLRYLTRAALELNELERNARKLLDRKERGVLQGSGDDR